LFAGDDPGAADAIGISAGSKSSERGGARSSSRWSVGESLAPCPALLVEILSLSRMETSSSNFDGYAAFAKPADSDQPHA
jgi:hypothetical protein